MKRFNLKLPFIMLGFIFGCATKKPILIQDRLPERPFSSENTATFVFEQKPQLDNIEITEEDFYRFNENLKYVYLSLAQGQHLSFQPNTEKIESGTIINNTEQVGNQFTEHNYHIEVDTVNKEIRWSSNPSIVTIKPFGIKVKNATYLTVRYNNGLLSTKLEIVFKNKHGLKQALNNNLRELWGPHVEREMNNSSIIIQYLKKTNQLYSPPNTWNFKEVINDLK